MNNKLICPFCGEELEDAGIHSAGFYFWCTNCYMKQKEKDDNYTASPRIWQALIQAKQDLEIVVDALKPFADRDNWDFEHCFVDNPQLLAGTALEQIEHKE